MNLTSSPFHQVAFVVEDLDAAVRHWADVLGVGPYSVWTLDPAVLHDATYDGEPASFSFRHALGWSGPMQIELVQPLAGPSIFADQLTRSGPGLNHVGRLVDDHPAACAELLAEGYIPLQSARFGQSEDGRFAYFGSPAGDAIVELILPPTTRFAPDYVYPNDGA
jgi:catechol 2,3-dioxygenase-like lactoylglutathione lyase family enzyme